MFLNEPKHRNLNLCSSTLKNVYNENLWWNIRTTLPSRVCNPNIWDSQSRQMDVNQSPEGAPELHDWDSSTGPLTLDKDSGRWMDLHTKELLYKVLFGCHDVSNTAANCLFTPCLTYLTHVHSEAWWGQHHAVGVFVISWFWKEWQILQKPSRFCAQYRLWAQIICVWCFHLRASHVCRWLNDFDEPSKNEF